MRSLAADLNELRLVRVDFEVGRQRRQAVDAVDAGRSFVAIQPAADVVGVVQRYGQQKGPVVLAPQVGNGLVGHRIVGIGAAAGGRLGLQHLEAGYGVATGKGIGVGKMPLARPRRVIAGSPEHLAHVGDGRVDRLAVDVNARLVRHTTRDEAAARGTADGRGAIRFLEAHPGGGDGVHGRRVQMRIAVGAHGPQCLLVGEDEENVGAIHQGCGCHCQRHLSGDLPSSRAFRRILSSMRPK